jgi:hypothetical protein
MTPGRSNFFCAQVKYLNDVSDEMGADRGGASQRSGGNFDSWPCHKIYSFKSFFDRNDDSLMSRRGPLVYDRPKVIDYCGN